MESQVRRRRVTAARRILPDDWERFRDVRLESLRDHPEAFTADLAVESALTRDDWRARCSEAWFTCEIRGVFAGTAKYWRDSGSAKTAHVGHLGALYVRGAFRGQGVGDALIEAVTALAWDEGAEFVVLGVHTKNLSAQALYERHGFKAFGMLPGALKVDGVYWDEIHMVRLLTTGI
ncbi:MAG: putative GCN5-related N-acetyltransferase [Alphaproteobacteria bacterium]|nr:putative GCN5-related N-acetyltransferase [Alphaproteobacteria bacterium]MDB5739076.1 putative GCN5-related N-acetyltransferase [Alphaproteobacteria bacterium]